MRLLHVTDSAQLVIVSNIVKLIILNTGEKIRVSFTNPNVKQIRPSSLMGYLLLVPLLVLFAINPSQATDDTALKNEKTRFQDSLVFNDKGVPYYNYSYSGHDEIGLQGSPHAVASNAITLYKQYMRDANETAKTYFINNADWLVNTDMLKNNGSFSTYEFSFSWKNGNHTIEAPWRNGMVNGEALNVLAKAYQVTGNMTYLDTAKRILNSFYIGVKDGGVTYKTPTSGWWYEEYATRNSTEEPRVLNGMIHSIIGINEYYRMSNDTSAKFLFDQGILALKYDLPKYDFNGTSYYDKIGRAHV